MSGESDSQKVGFVGGALVVERPLGVGCRHVVPVKLQRFLREIMVQQTPSLIMRCVVLLVPYALVTGKRLENSERSSPTWIISDARSTMW